MNTKWPEKVYCTKEDKDKYNKIIEIETFFENRNRKDQFMFALAYGYKNEFYPEIKDTRDEMFWSRDLKPIDEAILSSIAIEKTGDIEIIGDKKKIIEIAERYAHGGIETLYQQVTSSQFGSYSKKIEVELTNAYQEIFEKGD